MSSWRSYLTAKSPTTSEDLRGRVWCCHRPGVMGAGFYPNLDRCILSLSFVMFHSQGSPYIPFWISRYTKRLCANFLRFYCWIILSGIMSSGSFKYSYLSMGLFKQNLEMFAHMNFAFFVDNTMLKISLAVVRSAVDVVTSPGRLIKFYPTVSRVFQPFAVVFQPQLSHR